MQVYSASKHVQDVRDAPSSVTVITSDEIQKYGYRTLADLLQTVRGLYVTYDRDYSNLGVRGFGRLGDWNSRVLVLIDGHRSNNNVAGQAMIGSEFLLDVDLIDRVEIIRGASSSLYGTDAFFAVINVITRKSPDLKGLELSFGPASYGTFQGRATYGGQYEGMNLLLSGTFYDSQGQTLFFPEYNNPATNNGITHGTDYENSQHLAATISYRGFTLQGLFSARDKGVPTGYFGTVFNDPRTRNLDYHQYLDLSYQHSVGEKWELAARTSYDQSRLQAPLVFATGLPDGSTTLDTFSFRGNWWNGDIKLSRTFFTRHHLTIGSEATDNLRQDQGDYLASTNAFQSDPASSMIWALYGQDEFSILRSLILSAGVRYDHYSNFGGTTNPRLGLIYHLHPQTTLKLLYGSAFRAPAPFEITPGFGAFYEDNLKLQPERIRSYEAILEQAAGKNLHLSVNLFQNSIDRLITLEIDPANGQAVYLNSGRADAFGGALEADARLHGVETRLSYNYSEVIDRVTQRPVSNSPKHLAKLNIAVPVLPRGRLFAAVDAQYTDSRNTLAGHTVPDFALFNVTLLSRSLGKHLDASASIYNLFDKKYFDPGRPEDLEDVIQQDGRNFRIKITGRF